MTPIASLRHGLRRDGWRFAYKLSTDARGASAVEFALIAPVFCLILVGAADFGGMLYTKFGLDGAVSAAANYAVINASNVNSTSGSSLATALAEIVASGHAANWATATIVVNNGPSATLSSGAITTGGTASNADLYYCPTRSGSGAVTWGTAMAQGTSCTGGGIAGKFVSIAANRPYSPIFSSYAFVSNHTIGATTVVEAQ